MIAASGGKVIAAAWSGKIKTASTMVGLCIMMVFSYRWLDWVVIAVILITTLVSGIEYFMKNGSVLGLGRRA